MIEAISPADVVMSFTDFLVVVTHQILCFRSIYPATSFLLARKYNFAVHQNRHGKVRDFVNTGIQDMGKTLLEGKINLIALVIFDKAGLIWERFTFDVSMFSTSLNAWSATISAGSQLHERNEDILPVVDMEEQFRAALSVLSQHCLRLPEPPKGCLLTMAMELEQTTELRTAGPISYIQAPTVATVAAEAVQTHPKPLRAIKAGILEFQFSYEASEPRAEALDSSSSDDSETCFSQRRSEIAGERRNSLAISESTGSIADSGPSEWGEG